MAIDSDAFKSWSAEYGKRSAFRGIKAEAKWGNSTEKTPIKISLYEISEMATDPSPDLLISNVLYACYQAENASKLKIDPAAKRREDFKGAFDALYKHQQAIRDVADLFRRHPDAMIAALNYPSDNPLSQGDRDANVESKIKSVQTVLAIPSVLEQVLAGFHESKADDEPYFLDMVANEVEGPFLFLNRNDRRGPKSNGKRRTFQGLVRDGLLFHLTYLFRFFTRTDEEKRLNFFARMTPEGRLAFLGPMINVGDPNRDLVAHFFNATFPAASQSESFTGQIVSDRLATLLSPPRKRTKSGSKKEVEGQPDKLSNTHEKIKVAVRKNKKGFSVHFDGWPT